MDEPVHPYGVEPLAREVESTLVRGEWGPQRVGPTGSTAWDALLGQVCRGVHVDVVDSGDRPSQVERWDGGRVDRSIMPGGRAGVLGYDIQHSESTPHVQILADTFADDPKHEDRLRVETSLSWFPHRDVRDEDGRQISGKTKMVWYHQGLKEHLSERGHDISLDFDELRHLTGLGKADYGVPRTTWPRLRRSGALCVGASSTSGSPRRMLHAVRLPWTIARASWSAGRLSPEASSGGIPGGSRRGPRRAR